MKKFLGVMLGVLLIGSIGVTKAHAFTIDDLMSQIATLRTEVAQLRGNLGGQVLGATADGTMSSDTKDSAGSTGVAPKPVPVPPQSVPPTPSAGTTVNPPADPSFAPPIGYWLKTESGSCVWTLKRPANSITCAGSESFGSTTTGSTQVDTSLARPGRDFYYVMYEGTSVCVAVRVLPTKGYRSCEGPGESLTNPTTPTFSKSLMYGDAKSVDVVNLQVALKSAGFLNATPNGTFGPATRTAVMAVQRAKGLPVTGVADSKTVAAINVKEGTMTTSTKVGSGTEASIDGYIKSIPDQIASLQTIQKNPASFKAEVMAGTIGKLNSSSDNLQSRAEQETIIVQGQHNCLIYDWYPGMGGWVLTGLHSGSCAVVTKSSIE